MKIFLLVLCLLSTSLFADDFVFDKENGRAVPAHIGQAKLFIGKVFVTKKGETKQIDHGERFAVGDKVKTMEKSILKILMIDDTVITLGANTEMDFSEFQFTDKTDRKSIYHLMKGQLSGEVKVKAKDDAIQFKTKYVAMGVRGTKVLVNFRTEGTKEISQFALTEGKAHVNNQAIIKGEHLIFIHDIDKKKDASEKKILPPEELEQLLALNMDEEKDFRPLLPYFELTKITPESPLWKLMDQIIEADTKKGEEIRERLKKDNPSWKENLQKLNQQLKENHRKKN